MLSAQDIGDLLRVSGSTVTRWGRKRWGGFPAPVLREGGKSGVRWMTRDVVAWLESKDKAAKDPPAKKRYQRRAE